MVIEYSLPRISVISSHIIANKTLILSIFCKNGGRHLFPQKKRMWSNKMKFILRSFLKLECFGYYNNNGDFINQQY